MLMCDGCDRGFHIYCLDPPLQELPSDKYWCCEECNASGCTAEHIAAIRSKPLRSQGQEVPLTLTNKQQQADRMAQSMDGASVTVLLQEDGQPVAQMQGRFQYLERKERKRQLYSLRLDLPG